MDPVRVCVPVPFLIRAIALEIDPVKVPDPLLLPMLRLFVPALLMREPLPMSASMVALLEPRSNLPLLWTVTETEPDPRALALLLTRVVLVRMLMFSESAELFPERTIVPAPDGVPKVSVLPAIVLERVPLRMRVLPVAVRT